MAVALGGPQSQVDRRTGRASWGLIIVSLAARCGSLSPNALWCQLAEKYTVYAVFIRGLPLKREYMDARSNGALKM